MGLSKSTTASYIVLPGAQGTDYCVKLNPSFFVALLQAEPCSQRRRSRAANWLKSLKSKISNRARKHDDQTARLGEEREEVEELSSPARPGEVSSMVVRVSGLQRPPDHFLKTGKQVFTQPAACSEGIQGVKLAMKYGAGVKARLNNVFGILSVLDLNFSDSLSSQIHPYKT
ncbi:hypothetical protein PCASD_25612 [Puccinia coronata f. sp. avenae]|uniref:Uncharacterized protein n=1 Tax=Puccinia coronata f. sp. avenae TaxID=200324 RepID=A0A2N5TM53_9BASI|nr:hypothetical protein PCASD_25612 [Puccinia coronata f. sp. avenae]